MLQLCIIFITINGLLLILQGKISLGENNQDSFGAVIPTTPVTTFILGTSSHVAKSSYEQYILYTLVKWALTKDLTLSMTVHRPTGIYILYFSWELHILSLSRRQSEKRKICKEFFFRCPTLTPAALPGDSCHLHCLTFAIGRLGCTSVQKGLCGQRPEVLLSPYDFQAVNMAFLGAPGGCAQQGHQSQAEADHCIIVGPSLGGLARSCQGFQSSSGGSGRGFDEEMWCKEWWSLFIPRTAQWRRCYAPSLFGVFFQALEPNHILLFLVAVVQWSINK